MIRMRAAFRPSFSFVLLAVLAGLALSASPAGNPIMFASSATPALNATAENAKAAIDALQIEIGAAKANHTDTRTAETEYWNAVEAYRTGQNADALVHVENARTALQATGGVHTQTSPVPPTPTGTNAFIAGLTPSSIIVYGGAIIVIAVVVVFLLGGADGPLAKKARKRNR